MYHVDCPEDPEENTTINHTLLIAINPAAIGAKEMFQCHMAVSSWLGSQSSPHSMSISFMHSDIHLQTWERNLALSKVDEVSSYLTEAQAVLICIPLVFMKAGQCRAKTL